jgi:hypothetical protein
MFIVIIFNFLIANFKIQYIFLIIINIIIFKVLFLNLNNLFNFANHKLKLIYYYFLSFIIIAQFIKIDLDLLKLFPYLCINC